MWFQFLYMIRSSAIWFSHDRYMCQHETGTFENPHRLCARVKDDCNLGGALPKAKCPPIKGADGKLKSRPHWGHTQKSSR